MLRGISQRDLDRLAGADGYGKTEMSRVERGELAFRPGKHIEPLSRYLQVPRWWFTATTVTLEEEPVAADGSISDRLEQIAGEVQDFRAWAEDAVKKILNYRTGAFVQLTQEMDAMNEVLTAVAKRFEVDAPPGPPGEVARRLRAVEPTEQDQAPPGTPEADDAPPSTG